MTGSEHTEERRRSFGEELRREREIRGISVKEIADATKVSSRFLQAIERDDFNVLPAPVFTRGFVREYAKYLGLNTDDAVNRYMHFVEEWDAAGEKGRFGLRDTGPREAAPSQFTALWIIVVTAALLAGAALWWWKGRPANVDDRRSMGRVMAVSEFLNEAGVPFNIQNSQFNIPQNRMRNVELGIVNVELTQLP